jgi:hypothetical protein
LLEPDTNSKDLPHGQARRRLRLSLGPAWHSRRPRQRHCGTGIWPDRDIAAGWRGIDTPCASLPTRSLSQPRTPARKAGVLDLRKRIRERDRLPAGGSRIRTISSAKGPSAPSQIFQVPLISAERCRGPEKPWSYRRLRRRRVLGRWGDKRSRDTDLPESTRRCGSKFAGRATLGKVARILTGAWVEASETK